MNSWLPMPGAVPANPNIQMLQTRPRNDQLIIGQPPMPTPNPLRNPMLPQTGRQPTPLVPQNTPIAPVPGQQGSVAAPAAMADLLMAQARGGGVDSPLEAIGQIAATFAGQRAARIADERAQARKLEEEERQYQRALRAKEAEYQLAQQYNDIEGDEFGTTVHYAMDEAGNVFGFQVSKGGESRQIALPEGARIASGFDRVDAGTHFEIIDKRSGETVGKVEKHLGEAEAQKAAGKAQGEAIASLPSGIANAEKTVGQINELLEHDGTDRIVGRIDQYKPGWAMGDDARDAKSRLDQLQGGAFLQAFEMLKGGGQITEIEGKKAEQAMARLDRALSDDDFKAALTDFRDAVQEGMAKLREQAGVTAPQATGGAPAQASAAQPEVINRAGTKVEINRASDGKFAPKQDGGAEPEAGPSLEGATSTGVKWRLK